MTKVKFLSRSVGTLFYKVILPKAGADSKPDLRKCMELFKFQSVWNLIDHNQILFYRCLHLFNVLSNVSIFLYRAHRNFFSNISYPGCRCLLRDIKACKHVIRNEWNKAIYFLQAIVDTDGAKCSSRPLYKSFKTHRIKHFNLFFPPTKHCKLAGS